MRSRIPIVIGTVAVAAAALAAWLFPRAFPTVALEQSLTPDLVVTRADSFFRAHSLAPAHARTAVRFAGDDSLRIFVELAGGGVDSLNALIRGDDIAPFIWSVRAFAPGNLREARVDFAPDGRIIGFEHELAEADPRPTVSADSGRRLAENVIGHWINDRADRWKLVASSYETRKTSGRIDRSYTFERINRRIGGAPIRAEAVIAGDLPSRLRPFVEIPQSFQRRYAGMRSWNELITLLATLGFFAIGIAGTIALTRFARARRVRWREAMLVGSVIGGLILLAALNSVAGGWFSYDTAMSPSTYTAFLVMLALVSGVITALLVGFTLAAAEAATRHAFPRHLDWWKLWRYRGTREVAARVGGGYAVAAIAFAYVTLFYLVTRKLFGWWVPAELLNDPNQIASRMPWIAAIAPSLQAGVWEEALFRALPLSLLSLWVGQRRGRRWWMAAGVILTAVIFGFAHASYQSWPPYSRGVEIFFDACFWAVLFLRFGLLVTVIGHFLYDAVLFGIFAAFGTATEYRVTAAIILGALLAPALVVLWRAVRQGGFAPAPEDARFAAWTPITAEEPSRPVSTREPGVFTGRARRLAVAAAVAGILVAVGRPPGPTLGPDFTVPRARILQTADSVVRAHGVNPAGWTRLYDTHTNDDQTWPRFLREKGIEGEAQRLASSYMPAAWWAVRYVHTAGTAAERTEEWQVSVWPDGRPMGIRHVIPDAAPGRTTDSTAASPVDPAAVRRIALAAVARSGLDSSKLKETEFRETPRPARTDFTVTYTDTTVKLPAGAAARARVQIAGDQLLGVGRRVELPEAFLRADRQHMISRIMVLGVSMLILLALFIAGVIIVKHRLPVVLHDGPLDRKTRLLLVGGLAVLSIVTGLNTLPSDLASYDTAQPWSGFLGRTALGFAAPLFAVLLVVGMLIVLDALRRRVGIPMLPGRAKSVASDLLVAGLGIGGLSYAAHGLDALVGTGMPSPPSTGLDAVVPWLSGIFDIPLGTLAAISSIGIPILIVAGLTPRWRSRVILAVFGLALAALVWWAVPTDDADSAQLVLFIAGIVVVVLAAVAWGGVAAWSWIVAMLAYQAFGGLRDAVYGAQWQDRTGGVLTVLIASAFIVTVVRSAQRSREPLA